MTFSPFGKLPWDLVVFLSITTVGLGVSFKRLAYPENFSTESAEIQALTREPESIIPASRFTVDLGCLDRKAGNERVTHSEKSIRIRGKFCNLSRRQMRTFDGARIRNITTGYEGTVFFQGQESTFMSETLDLKSGKNILQIEWRENKNSPFQTLLTEVFEK